jgi:DNA-directed RNA polymerase sigma subunit (sigma70/sigma32)
MNLTQERVRQLENRALKKLSLMENVIAIKKAETWEPEPYAYS